MIITKKRYYPWSNIEKQEDFEKALLEIKSRDINVRSRKLPSGLFLIWEAHVTERITERGGVRALSEEALKLFLRIEEVVSSETVFEAITDDEPSNWDNIPVNSSAIFDEKTHMAYIVEGGSKYVHLSTILSFGENSTCGTDGVLKIHADTQVIVVDVNNGVQVRPANYGWAKIETPTHYALRTRGRKVRTYKA